MTGKQFKNQEMTHGLIKTELWGNEIINQKNSRDEKNKSFCIQYQGV